MQVSAAEPRKREDLGAMLSPAKKSRDSTADICVEGTDGDEGAVQCQEETHIGQLLGAPGPHFTVPRSPSSTCFPSPGGARSSSHVSCPLQPVSGSVLASGKI